jgi:hypothetical protein
LIALFSFCEKFNKSGLSIPGDITLSCLFQSREAEALQSLASTRLILLKKNKIGGIGSKKIKRNINVVKTRPK